MKIIAGVIFDEDFYGYDDFIDVIHREFTPFYPSSYTSYGETTRLCFHPGSYWMVLK